MKENLEIIEKFIIVLALVGGLIASTYKGYEYITAKTLVVEAKAAQEKEIGNAQRLLTKTYSDLLKNIDNDIRELDKKLEKEVFDGTVGWDKLGLIREQKVNDRNKLLTILGEQVSNFKNQPNKNELAKINSTTQKK